VGRGHPLRKWEGLLERPVLKGRGSSAILDRGLLMLLSLSVGKEGPFNGGSEKS